MRGSCETAAVAGSYRVFQVSFCLQDVERSLRQRQRNRSRSGRARAPDAAPWGGRPLSREPSPRAATGPAGASLLHPSPRPPSAAGAGKGLGRSCRGAFAEPALVRSTGHSGPGGTHRTRALPGGRPLRDTEASSLGPPFRTQILQAGTPQQRGLPGTGSQTEPPVLSQTRWRGRLQSRLSPPRVKHSPPQDSAPDQSARGGGFGLLPAAPSGAQTTRSTSPRDSPGRDPGHDPSQVGTQTGPALERGARERGRDTGERRVVDRSPVERPRRTGCRTAGDARGSTQPSSPEPGAPPRTATYGPGREPGRPRAERSRSRTPLGARGSAGRSRLQRRSPPRLGAAPAPPSAVPHEAAAAEGRRTSVHEPELPRPRKEKREDEARADGDPHSAAPAAPPPSACSAASAGTQPDTPHGPARPGCTRCGHSLSSGSLTNPGARGDPQRSGVFTSETPGPRGTPCGSRAEKRGGLDRASPHRVPGIPGVERSSREHFPLQTRPRLGANPNAASSSSHASPTPTGSSRPRTWPRRRGRRFHGLTRERAGRSGGSSGRTSPRRTPGLGSGRRALTPGAARALKRLRRNAARDPVRANSGTASRFLGGDARPELPRGRSCPAVSRADSRAERGRARGVTAPGKAQGPQGPGALQQWGGAAHGKGRKETHGDRVRVRARRDNGDGKAQLRFASHPRSPGPAQSRGGRASRTRASRDSDPPQRLFLETRGRLRALGPRAPRGGGRSAGGRPRSARRPRPAPHSPRPPRGPGGTTFGRSQRFVNRAPPSGKRISGATRLARARQLSAGGPGAGARAGGPRGAGRPRRGGPRGQGGRPERSQGPTGGRARARAPEDAPGRARAPSRRPGPYIFKCQVHEK
ncbi:collagen alpha-1(I) chain-like [Mustela erminea]|uniref:collagen alpha-1(I) chain-like n=1 Tax=Mustela erminea TaxID=36723 RepID=UPI00138740F2|nr:collagen alpha-1(I) chain-like [Mustela erminea]